MYRPMGWNSLMHKLCYGWILFCVGFISAETTPTAGVLNLQGRQLVAPDILFLYPDLTDEIQAPLPIYTKAMAQGTSFFAGKLSFETLTRSGILPMLATAGYQVWPVKDVAWSVACEQLVEILRLRHETRIAGDVKQVPICAVLNAEVSSQVFQDCLPSLLASEALIIMMPSTKLPMLVTWKNVVWPAHQSHMRLRAEHWLATLAEVAGFPPPAICGAVSVLPLLTGCGYQRALNYQVSTASGYSEMRYFETLPEACPWVPDMTVMIPDERIFLASAFPIECQACSWLKPRRTRTGLYLTLSVERMDIHLPLGVSMVTRVCGEVVHEITAEGEDRRWLYQGAGMRPVECFIEMPPAFDPRTLPFFKTVDEK